MMLYRALCLLGAASLVSACSLEPSYERPAGAVPEQWPTGAAYQTPTALQSDLPWQTLITNTKLKDVIGQALLNNRDLRASIANVASVRAQYQVQRSAQLPTLEAGGSADIVKGHSRTTGSGNAYAADASVSGFEIDLFGRLKTLGKAAFERYLATDAGRRSTIITLIGETGTAYTRLASDMDLLRVSRDTMASATRSMGLTKSLDTVGLSSAVDLTEAETVVAQAQSDIEGYTTAVAQDRNALELLVGSPVPDALLPTSLDELDGTVGQIPAGLSSTVLLQRPDVQEAEHTLKAANANIGAARAAFFPTLTLTSAAGVASTALSNLMTGGALGVSFAPAVTVPVLGGTAPGNLNYAKAQKSYYSAAYEKVVQTAFEEVANALARRGTIDRQREAQRRLAASAAKSLRLADAQYKVGSAGYLSVLVAQRTFYNARQSSIATVFADISNRIALYQAIGADPVN
jgi:multidrug efflux system outer membrane protein